MENTNTKRELSLGLVADEIMSAPRGLVKGYILNRDEYEAYENGGLGLTDMVSKSINEWMGNHISITDVGPCINGTAVDQAHYCSDVRLNLYMEDIKTVPVAMEVVSVCAANGIPLTLWHFDAWANRYVPQVLF